MVHSFVEKSNIKAYFDSQHLTSVITTFFVFDKILPMQKLQNLSSKETFFMLKVYDDKISVTPVPYKMSLTKGMCLAEQYIIWSSRERPT